MLSKKQQCVKFGRNKRKIVRNYTRDRSIKPLSMYNHVLIIDIVTKICIKYEETTYRRATEVSIAIDRRSLIRLTLVGVVLGAAFSGDGFSYYGNVSFIRRNEPPPIDQPL